MEIINKLEPNYVTGLIDYEGNFTFKKKLKMEIKFLWLLK